MAYRLGWYAVLISVATIHQPEPGVFWQSGRDLIFVKRLGMGAVAQERSNLRVDDTKLHID
jgi:hypothetical protein